MMDYVGIISQINPSYPLLFFVRVLIITKEAKLEQKLVLRKWACNYEESDPASLQRGVWETLELWVGKAIGCCRQSSMGYSSGSLKD